MSNNLQVPKQPPLRRRKTRWRWAWRIAIPVAVVWGAYALLHRPEAATKSGTTFTVRRGPMKITVLEGGNLEAMESQKIKSEVEGQTKILSIVPEGYVVTQEDVDKGKVLIDLDSKDLEDKKIAEELEYQNAAANFTEAKEEYEIQANQNRSDVMTAQLTAKFARMDFEKFMGTEASKEILVKLGLADVNLETVSEDEFLPPPAPEPPAAPEVPKEKPAGSPGEQARPGDAQGAQPPPAPEAAKPLEAPGEKQASASPPSGPAAEAAAEKPPETPEEVKRQSELRAAHAALDFTKYADSSLLGDGEAQQKLRKLEDDELLAQKELVLSQTQFEGTKRLAEKDFVTKNDLENERLKVERNEIALESAKTAKDLFIRYEFVKTAEKALSDYEEALAKLERAKKLARSKMAQAAAKRRSSEKRFNLQTAKLREIYEQLDKCRIRAKRPGLVVYAHVEEWRSDDQIREGAMVRNRQDLIEIPDLSEMAVKVKIHEASIKLVQNGQKAKLKVDAFPDEELTGKVVQVGILPDSENRWMNPDVKVYETKISIDGSHDWVKPGMSAQVEVLVKELSDVVYVPIQAVVPADGEKVCYVVRRLASSERRVIEVGDFNNEFIEIKSGLSEGEEVLLSAPVVPEEAGKKEKGKVEEEEKGKDQEQKVKQITQNQPKASSSSSGGKS